MNSTPTRRPNTNLNYNELETNPEINPDDNFLIHEASDQNCYPTEEQCNQDQNQDLDRPQ